MSRLIWPVICVACHSGDLEFDGETFTCRGSLSMSGSGQFRFKRYFVDPSPPPVAVLVSNEFVWKMEPSELEKYLYFLVDDGSVLSRVELMKVTVGHPVHQVGCDCGRHG